MAGAGSKKLNILFLTQRIPWPPIKGEKIRPGAIMRHFAERHDVYLATMIDDPADVPHEATVRAQVHRAQICRMPRSVSYVQAAVGLLTGQPLSFAFFRNPRLGRWVRGIVKNVKPDIIFVCSSNMVQFLGSELPNARTIVDFADVDSLKWDNYAARARGIWRWIYRREAAKVRAEEKRISAWADACTFVTDDEATLFKELVPEAAAKTLALSSGVDIDYFTPHFHGPSPFASDAVSFVFTGTMDYLPNVDAVTWFALEVLPLIQATRPGAQFYIVGANPSPDVQRLAQVPGVFVTHRVPDVRPYLAHCAAAVAPLRIARGIQNKVLEAMAMGRPTVVTSGALTGIDAAPGTHLVLADTAEEFARACLDLCQDHAHAEKLGRAARELIETAYSWPARLAAFDDLLVGSPRASATPLRQDTAAANA